MPFPGGQLAEPIGGWLFWSAPLRCLPEQKAVPVPQEGAAAVGGPCMCFLWFTVHLYCVLAPLGCLVLGQWRALGSGARVRACSLFPTDHPVLAVWAVFGSMDGPGIGIRASHAFPFISSATCMSRAPAFLSWCLSACPQCQRDVLSISSALPTQLSSPCVYGGSDLF